MHYLLTVPEFEGGDPTNDRRSGSRARGIESGRRAFAAKLEELDRVKDDDGNGFSGRLLSLVMLNVLDEKWKDHLYDLDQLRGAIHYRSWGQKDPLIEYKQEAYSMFVDLMNDIFNTFTERFFRAQLVFQQPNDGSAAGWDRRREQWRGAWPRSAAQADEALQRARHPRGHSRGGAGVSNGNSAGNGDGTVESAGGRRGGSDGRRAGRAAEEKGRRATGPGGRRRGARAVAESRGERSSRGYR